LRFFRVATSAGPRWAREEAAARLRILDAIPERPSDTAEWIDATACAARPVAPSKIIGIGVNYRDHAAERGKPVPRSRCSPEAPSSVIGPNQAIRRPSWAGRVDHEAELGIVIGAAPTISPRRGGSRLHLGRCA